MHAGPPIAIRESVVCELKLREKRNSSTSPNINNNHIFCHVFVLLATHIRNVKFVRGKKQSKPKWNKKQHAKCERKTERERNIAIFMCRKERMAVAGRSASFSRFVFIVFVVVFDVVRLAYVRCVCGVRMTTDTEAPITMSTTMATPTMMMTMNWDKM